MVWSVWRFERGAIMKCQMAEIFLRAVVSLNLKSAAVLKSCKPRVNQRHQSHQLLKKRTNRRLVLSRDDYQICLINSCRNKGAIIMTASPSWVEANERKAGVRPMQLILIVKEISTHPHLNNVAAINIFSSCSCLNNWRSVTTAMVR